MRSAPSSSRPARLGPAARLGLLLLAAPLLGACKGTSASVKRIVEYTSLLEERFRSGDMLGVADFYAEDAVLFAPGGQRYRGRKQIDAYWSNITEPVDWELEIRSIEGNEDIILERGTSKLQARYAGELRTSVVEFAFLWRKDPKTGWQIWLDAFWRP